MTYILLHDTSGTFLAVKRVGREEENLIFFEEDVKWSTTDNLSRLVYREVTEEDSDRSVDSPLAVRYGVTTDIEEHLLHLYILEPIRERSTLSLRNGYVWKRLDEPLMSRLARKYCHSQLLQKAIRNIPGETSGHMANDTVPWFSRGGCVEKAKETFRIRLRSYGYKDIKTVKQRQINTDSMIFCAETDGTFVFQKVSGHGCPEALITQTLAKLFPKQVVVPFGVDYEENSFFSETFGYTLGDLEDEEEDTEMELLFCDAVNAIAQFHIDAARYVEDFRAIGMEDTSPQTLRDKLPEFVGELRSRGILDKEQAVTMNGLLPKIKSMLKILIDGKIPLTVCHGDLHDENITGPNEEDGSLLLFDWYMSSVSHPFFDFTNGDFHESPFTELYIALWHEYDSEEKLIDLQLVAEKLVPLWEAYRILKVRARVRHQHDLETDQDICKDSMRELIESFQAVTDVSGEELR